MGCGCSKNNRSVRTPSSQVLTPTGGRLMAAGQSLPPLSAAEIQQNPNVMDQDRLRIERLRREAIRRSLGK